MHAEGRARAVKLLVLDVDGVLTDGGLYYDAEGNVLKRFDVQDGLGIKVAQGVGITVAVITGLDMPCVNQRMKALGISDYYAGFLDKVDCLDTIRKKYNLQWHEMAYLGDDWVDLPPMAHVGLPMAVANALPEVKAKAAFITVAQGGHGAVREAIQFILTCRGLLDEAMARWTRHA